MSAGTGRRGRLSGRRLLAVLALVAVVTLAGCSLLFGGDDPTASLPSGDEPADQYLSLRGFEATGHSE